jgi:hypothetical protein
MTFKWYLCSAICFVFLVTGTLLLASSPSQQSNTNSIHHHKRSISGTRKAATGAKKTKKQKAKSHCDDSEPANPSKCNVNQSYVVGCTPPFTGIVTHPVDERCPNEGCAIRPSDKAQNRVKNNLCATGTPVQISFTSLDKLQRAVNRMVQQGKITYGSTGPPQPSDRSKLRNLSTVDASGTAITLGEGKLVTIDAFVLDAKHDDTYVLGSGPVGFGGEGVNCKNSLFEWNDIHIALGRTASASECSSVTAEIIPHLRPALWDRFDTNSCTSRHVDSPLKVEGLRVRLTGQLFFDGSHKPSPCGAATGGGNPLRRSVWEIHPVYKIEVLDGTQFVSLEDWAASHP